MFLTSLLFSLAWSSTVQTTENTSIATSVDVSVNCKDLVKKVRQDNNQSYSDSEFSKLRNHLKSFCLPKAAKALSNASKLLAVSHDMSMRIIAYERAIFITHYKNGEEISHQVIWGSMTSLSLIEEISISPDKKLVAVLNDNLDGTRSLLFFNTEADGNVPPKYANMNKELIDVSNINFAGNGRLYALLKTEFKGFSLISYDPKKDSRGGVIENMPILQHELEISSSYIVADFVVLANSNIILLDQAQNHLIFINDQGEVVLKEKVSNLTLPQKLFFHQANKEIIIFNHLDDFSSYNL